MISVHDMTAAELAALLHFHADAGVEWLVEADAVDRFQEFETMQAARKGTRPAVPDDSHSRAAAAQPTPPPRAAAPVQAVRERPLSAVTVAIPDDQAIAQARFAAEGARSLDELRTALETFNGCNLKNSARSTVFAKGDPAGGVMIVGSMPNADDDRDGEPFAGRSGQMLDRMLAAIGLARSGVLLTTVLPWRPPGNRMPSQPEMEICRPFIERQIALAEPKALLLLGNFSVRFFFGGNETIHSLRGEWRDIACGAVSVPALASLHPQELMTAPINKRLAWNDLMAFRAALNARL